MPLDADNHAYTPSSWVPRRARAYGNFVRRTFTRLSKHELEMAGRAERIRTPPMGDGNLKSSPAAADFLHFMNLHVVQVNA